MLITRGKEEDMIAFTLAAWTQQLQRSVMPHDDVKMTFIVCILWEKFKKFESLGFVIGQEAPFLSRIKPA